MELVPKPEEKVRPIFELRIVKLSDGRTICHGPVDNERLCMALVGEGLVEIAKHNAQKAAQKILIANGMPAPPVMPVKPFRNGG